MKSGFVPSIQFQIDEARGRVGHCPSHPHTLVKQCCSISGEQRQVMIHSCSTNHPPADEEGLLYIPYTSNYLCRRRYILYIIPNSMYYTHEIFRIVQITFTRLGFFFISTSSSARLSVVAGKRRDALSKGAELPGVRISPVRVAQDILDDISPLRILYYYLTNNLSFTLFVISHTLSPGACTYYYYYYSLQST